MRVRATLAPCCAAAALLTLLAGCSATPEALESQPDAASQNYADNYQDVHRRLAGTAKRCLMGPSVPALAMVVEANLQKELGFGEVRFVAVGVVTANYFVS